MIEIKDLKTNQAKAVLKNLAEDVKTCMCCAHAKEFPYKVRAAGTSMVDDDGNFWFLCSQRKSKGIDLQPGNRVELIYSEPGQAHLLTVYGTASISKSREKLLQLWGPLAEQWFEDGINDANILLLKVVPTEAYYQDSRFGHMVALMNVSQRAA